MTLETLGGHELRRHPLGGWRAKMHVTKKVDCPRCGCGLVPVHRVHEGRRAVVALTCPEPYCGHTEELGAVGESPLTGAESEAPRIRRQPPSDRGPGHLFGPRR